ncbi:MAG TPA: hypothetical protein PKK48_01330 [Phycisphaerae bacterium]|nr:hypothetical protein [Phycisphaerae bacterium]
MENDRKKHGFDWLTATLLAWALPGMGHVFLGRAKRGIIICVTITALFWSGIAVGGVMTIDSRYEKWWFYAQILNGASGVISWLRSEREFREIEKTPEMQQLIADTLYMRAGMGFKTDRTIRISASPTGRPDELQMATDAKLAQKGISLACPEEDVARSYTGIAGLLNLLCMFDVFMLAVIGDGKTAEETIRKAGT